MTLKDIISLVIWCAFALYTLITIVLSVARKIRNRKTTGDKIDIKSIYSDIALSALEAIKDSENLFSSIAKDGAKTGTLKFNNVMTVIERLCNGKGVGLDIDYWTTFINSAVEAMNSNKSSQLDSNGDRVVGVRIYGGDHK